MRSIYTEAQVRAAVARAYEKAGKECTVEVTRPAGHNGAFEGYGPMKEKRNGKECASAIKKLAKKAATEPLEF